MANCEHDASGICKSCRQTIAEGGTVALTPDAQPPRRSRRSQRQQLNRREAVHYGVDGVGVLEGADLDFQQPTEFPCDDCGAMVDLSKEIMVSVVTAKNIQDGVGGTETKMTEANARALLAQVGIPPPPVLCDQHDDVGPITTEAIP